jgi:hypothetical protein
VGLYHDTKPDGTARTAADDIARRGGINRRTVLRSLKRLGLMFGEGWRIVPGGMPTSAWFNPG